MNTTPDPADPHASDDVRAALRRLAKLAGAGCALGAAWVTVPLWLPPLALAGLRSLGRGQVSPPPRARSVRHRAPARTAGAARRCVVPCGRILHRCWGCPFTGR